jgi:hypothetical protein
MVCQVLRDAIFGRRDDQSMRSDLGRALYRDFHNRHRRMEHYEQQFVQEHHPLNLFQVCI